MNGPVVEVDALKPKLNLPIELMAPPTIPERTINRATPKSKIIKNIPIIFPPI